MHSSIELGLVYNFLLINISKMGKKKRGKQVKQKPKLATMKQQAKEEDVTSPITGNTPPPRFPGILL